MNEKNITVNKTARYFILGESGDQINSIWFICHGYGQLASYFLRNFEVLNNGKNLLVAPEGLHRFYLKGYSDRVGASWMTKEDRLNDIKDYINFLDALYQEVISPFKGRKVKINVLGFSQGAATVSRWVAHKSFKPDNLILWSGAFPKDLPLEADFALFNSFKTLFIIGDQDEFINPSQAEEEENMLKQKGIPFELIKFNGKHEINTKVLKDIAEKI